MPMNEIPKTTTPLRIECRDRRRALHHGLPDVMTEHRAAHRGARASDACDAIYTIDLASRLTRGRYVCALATHRGGCWPRRCHAGWFHEPGVQALFSMSTSIIVCDIDRMIDMISRHMRSHAGQQCTGYVDIGLK